MTFSKLVLQDVRGFLERGWSGLVVFRIGLLGEMMRSNAIDTGDIISVSFTVTSDLRSEFPARCARLLEGWEEIPMICAAEVDVPGSLPMCIRVLMHIYSSLSRGDIRHVYLREARQLRPDWSAGKDGG